MIKVEMKNRVPVAIDGRVTHPAVGDVIEVDEDTRDALVRGGDARTSQKTLTRNLKAAEAEAERAKRAKDAAEKNKGKAPGNKDKGSAPENK